MKTKNLLMLALMSVMPFFVFAQEEWDDIYAPSKPKEKKKTEVKKVNEPQKQVNATQVLLVKDNGDVTLETVGNVNIDIDAYNRRGNVDVYENQYAENDTVYPEEYQYTDRIVRFHNPENSVKISSDGEINVYVLDDSYSNYYSNRIRFGFGWNSYYPWYDSWYYPSYAWSWYDPWYYGGWGWNRPWYYSNWGWSYGWYSPWYGGGWYIGHNNNHHGYRRPYYNYTAGRPRTGYYGSNRGSYTGTGRGSSVSARPGYSTGRGSSVSARPGTTTGGRGSSGNVTTRPSTRPDYNSSTGSNTGRSSSGNVTTRPSTRSDYNSSGSSSSSRPSYNSSDSRSSSSSSRPSYNSSSSSSYSSSRSSSSGSSGSSSRSSGGSSGGSSRGGGGRGR
jgi:hypothetical protein